jgi:hypothetical protein
MHIQRLVPVIVALWLVALMAPPAEAATVVGLWHMDDIDRVMNDSSANNLDGSISSNVVTGQAGALGTAFLFQSKPAWVSVPNSTKLNPGTGTFTVSVRVAFTVKPSSEVGDYDLARKGLSSTSGGNWKVEILRSGYAYCVFRGSSGSVSVTKGPDLSNGAWHTISCTRDSSGVRLTVDGSTSTKSGATGNISNSTTMFVGAKSSAGGDQYSGRLDELQITSG